MRCLRHGGTENPLITFVRNEIAHGIYQLGHGRKLCGIYYREGKRAASKPTAIIWRSGVSASHTHSHSHTVNANGLQYILFFSFFTKSSKTRVHAEFYVVITCSPFHAASASGKEHDMKAPKFSLLLLFFLLLLFLPPPPPPPKHFFYGAS